MSGSAGVTRRVERLRVAEQVRALGLRLFVDPRPVVLGAEHHEQRPSRPDGRLQRIEDAAGAAVHRSHCPQRRVHHEQIARGDTQAAQVSGDVLDGPPLRLHDEPGGATRATRRSSTRSGRGDAVRFTTTPTRLAPARSSASSVWRTWRRRLVFTSSTKIVASHCEATAMASANIAAGGVSTTTRRTARSESRTWRNGRAPSTADASCTGAPLASTRRNGVSGQLAQHRGEVVALEHRREPGRAGHAEALVHRRLAEVRVDDHDLLVEPGRRLGEVHRGERLARALVRAHDRERARLARAFEHHQVRSQDAERLDELDARSPWGSWRAPGGR